MSKHNETGIKGEQIAQNFLLNNGYVILHINWRHQKKEIDIIAQKNDILSFIEVKTRTGTTYGFPEDSVNRQKREFLKIAAVAFITRYPQPLQVRFDVISILLEKGTVKDILHYEAAFY